MNIEKPTPENAPRASSFALGAAAAAALLASACCVAPLALVLLGISGAWIGQLAALLALVLGFPIAAPLFY